MKTKLFAIALLLAGASCLTLVSCDGKKHDEKHTDTTVHIEGGTSDTLHVEHDVNIQVDTTHH